MWTEKYRPHDFSEVKGQQDVVNRVKAFVEQKNMPHLLFTGPAGVGKTTLAMIISKKLFGESWRENILELNASDERGIDIIRHKVKDFARTRAIGNVPFKIIYLDECDALTREAQQALRRTMENYTQTTRFILSANYSSKIIDPIQSRCAVFRFKPLEKADIIALVHSIAKQEHLELAKATDEALFEVSSGDCRKVENIMQSCAALSATVTPDMVFAMASVAKPKEINTILTLAIQQKFIEARNKLLETMLAYGLSGLDIIKQIQKEIVHLPMDNNKKIMLISACGETEFRMTEGSDEFVQLEAFLAQCGR